MTATMTKTSEPETATQTVSVERARCLILHVPQWFDREDFLDWRQGRARGQWQAPACWNPDERDGEHHDVFIVFDRRLVDHTPELGPEKPYIWDGTDLTGLPDDIYQAIGEVLAKRDLRYGILWLTAE
jgi:hypothetical protein